MCVVWWRYAAICDAKFTSGRLEGALWHGSMARVLHGMLAADRPPELLGSKWGLLLPPSQPLPSLNAALGKLPACWAHSLQCMPAAAAALAVCACPCHPVRCVPPWSAGTGKPVGVRTRTFDSVELDLSQDS